MDCINVARIVAIMRDGTLIVDRVDGFGHLVALLMGYRADEDCVFVHAYASDGRLLGVWRCHETRPDGDAHAEPPDADDGEPFVDPWTGEYTFEVA